MKKTIVILFNFLVSIILYSSEVENIKHLIEFTENNKIEHDIRVEKTEQLMKELEKYLSTEKSTLESDEKIKEMLKNKIFIINKKINDINLRVIGYKGEFGLFGTSEGRWSILQIYNDKFRMSKIIFENSAEIPIGIVLSDNKINFIIYGNVDIYKPMPVFFSSWNLNNNKLEKQNISIEKNELKEIEVEKYGLSYILIKQKLSEEEFSILNFSNTNYVDVNEYRFNLRGDRLQIETLKNNLIEEVELNKFKEIIRKYNGKNIMITIEELENAGIKEILREKPTSFTDEQYISILNDYAYFLSETERYKEAIPILEKVIELSPDRVVAYLNLGDCYIKEYKKSKKQSEKDKVIYNYGKYIDKLKEGAKIPERVKEITNYRVKKYNDKEENQINIGDYWFGFFSFNFIRQFEEYNNTKKYMFKFKKYFSDKEYKNYYMIIRPINNPNITDKKTTLEYIEKAFGETNEIKIDLKPWKDFDEKEHKVNKLIKIGKDKGTYYILYFKSSIFFIESNHQELENELFASDLENLSYYKYQVNCGGKDVATIEKTFKSDDNNIESEYIITQDKMKLKFTVKAFEKEFKSYLTLKDSKDNILLNLKSSEYLTSKMLYFIDKNKDGYIDIGYLYESNKVADWYTLYIWNNTKKIFEKQAGIYEADIYNKEQPSLKRIR